MYELIDKEGNKTSNKNYSYDNTYFSYFLLSFYYIAQCVTISAKVFHCITLFV